jgi:hypothetical protein
MTDRAELINCPVVHMMLQDSNARSHLLSRNQHSDNHSTFTNKAQHTRSLPCCPLPLCLPLGAAGLSFKGCCCHPGALQRSLHTRPCFGAGPRALRHSGDTSRSGSSVPRHGRGLGGGQGRSRAAAPAPTRGHGGPPRQSTSAQRRVTNTHTGHVHTRIYATDCTLHAPRADCVCRQ